MRNKKGDIPVTILIFGVAGICVLAILSFSFSLQSNEHVFAGPYLIEDTISVANQISFYSSHNIDFKSLLEKKATDAGAKIQITKNSDGTYLIIENFSNSKGDSFSVKYNFSPDK